MEIEKHLSADNFFILSNEDKTQVIKELVEKAMPDRSGLDKEQILEKLYYREELMSTGIGLGIGVPHIRTDLVKKPVIAVGISKNGVKDYTSVDNAPIHLVFLILTPEGQHRTHIVLLSQIVSLLKSETVRNQIIAAPDPKSASEFFFKAGL